jgi:endo-1,4-beta-xylanase
MHLNVRSVILIAFGAIAACGGSDGSPLVGATSCTDDPTQAKCMATVDPDSTLRLSALTSSRYMGNTAGSKFGTAAYNALLGREFSMLTPENALKFDAVHPARSTFAFTTPDAMYAFAVTNGMKMRGHTLVWYNQLPSWVTGTTWPVDTLKQIMIDHINGVMAHYKGQLYAWDVVNEALNDDGSRRTSAWSPIGPTYIETAFKTARAADPSALLFYNDYSLEFPGAKQDSAYAMIADFKARGVPIDGIGFQSHFQVNNDGSGVPSVATFTATMQRFASLGLKIHLTELDIRVRTSGITAAETTAQTQGFTNVVTACKAVTACEAIIVWGLDDGDSWIPASFPGYGNATLFDATLSKKPTYTSVKNAL